MKKIEDYSDIINMEHHRSEKHPALSMKQRAAQFSPFAALSGLEKQMDETRKRHDKDLYADS